MKHTPRHILAIQTSLLLQAANGCEDIPGLHAALECGTPMPAGLPDRHLARPEFLVDHVVPWLAARLRAGEALSDLVDDYEVCAEPRAGLGGRCGNTQIQQGMLAVEFSALRDILRHNDEVLNAVMEARLGAGVPDIGDLAQECVAQRWALPDLIAALWQVAIYMSMLGPVLRPRWPRLDHPIQLAPVVQHLIEVVQAMENSVDHDEELGQLVRTVGHHGRRAMTQAQERVRRGEFPEGFWRPQEAGPS